MRDLRSPLVGLLLSLAVAPTLQADATTGTIEAEIVKPISITEDADVSFGRLVYTSNGDAIIGLTKDGVLELPGNVQSLGGHHPGRFLVDGTDGKFAAIGVAEHPTCTNGATGLFVDHSPTAAILDRSVDVGMTIRIVPGTEGLVTCQFTLSASYFDPQPL